MMYKLIQKDKETQARRGRVKTSHGEIQTPFFMPVGTNGTLKSLLFSQLREIDAQIVLSNTYHLYLRPGQDVLRHAGGLHKFLNWDKPVLTDSGGYQVFSLTQFRKITEDGVKFKSHLDGSMHFFTPEDIVDIQRVIGSDMTMPLDVCAPYPCSRKEAEKSVMRTTQWARRVREYFLKTKTDKLKQHLFGIIQGATYKDLRQRSAQEIMDVNFDAYAIGGVSVGEPIEEMFNVLDWVMPLLPEKKARYFMGIGLPDQIVKAVGQGIDMFDTCVPTRYGRHGSAFTSKGRIILRNKEFEKDLGPIDEDCRCPVCRTHSRSYIRHLIRAKEVSGLTLVSYHNVYFYIHLMKRIREAIEKGCYREFEKEFYKKYGSEFA